MVKNQILGKNLNNVLKQLYNYKQFSISFKECKKDYLLAVKGSYNIFFHFYYEYINFEPIIVSVVINSWNIQKKVWNNDIKID